MADAKVTLKPSEQIIQAANQVTYVDAGGKRFGLKKPGVLQQFRIVEIVGESAKNDVYMAMINPLLWVADIDGDPVSPPTTKRELEALIQRVEEEGVVAISRQVYALPAQQGGSESIKN